MMGPKLRNAVRAARIICGGAFGLLPLFSQVGAAEPVTNIAGLFRQMPAGLQTNFNLRIEAMVCSASTSRRELVLADDSGAEVVRLNSAVTIRPGQKILLAGDGCGLRWEAWGVSIVPPPLIDNDRLHGPEEKSAKVFLEPGRVPVRVEWFNASRGRALELAWGSPGGAREKIPAAQIFTRDANGVETNGFAWQCYEGSWTMLPDFANLLPAASGVAPSVTLDVTTRHDFVGLVFEGELAVAHGEEYKIFLNSDDGSRLFIGESLPKISMQGEVSPPVPLTLKPGAVNAGARWAESSGTVRQVVAREDGAEIFLDSPAGTLRVELPGGATVPSQLTSATRVTVRGVAQEVYRPDGSRGFGIMKVASLDDLRVEPPMALVDSGTLTTAAQVEQLSPAEAQRRHPVKIRGVITCDAAELYYGNVLQDQTRGIYFYWATNLLKSGNSLRRPKFGEFWEVEGFTQPGRFAPDIQTERMKYLGDGQLPAPVSPAWDQLLNGSLDTQFVELEGIVTDAETNSVLFLTHGGKIRIDLTTSLAERLREKKNLLVRLRGCLLAVWDADTRQVKLREIRMGNVTVTADATEPADLFVAPQKNVDDLLRFDMAASSFQPVKISGQIVAKRGEEFFMSDGRRGLRFVPRSPEDLKPGDLVEVAGFPELDGPSPVLREAVVRRGVSAPLQEALRLKPEQVALPENDALRVRFEAVFNGVRAAGSDSLLDLRTAGNYFSARLRVPVGSVPDIEPGSRVELTGVYVSLSTARGPGHHLGAFEIVLTSLDDLRVIARPPWWTLRRLLAVTGALLAVLVLAALWITQLRRRVEERTEQLRHEISERERAEQQRMVAEEKSRIARDLHDDLGASLTEIGLQADVAHRAPLDTQQATEQFGVIADKTRTMVSALDAIVWAVDPEENTLQATAEYLGGFAEEFLSASGIDRRFKIPMELPPATVDGHQRHGIFLSVKETLNNIVRHAQATVVEFGVSFDGNNLRVEIADNGVGFDTAKTSGGYGVESLHKRLENLGGRCQIESSPGTGTKIKMILPIKK